MQRNWASRVDDGAKPSELLLEVLEIDPSLSGGQLAGFMMEEFPGIYRHAGTFVSRWIRPGATTTHGLTTADMDERVLELIAEWKAMHRDN